MICVLRWSYSVHSLQFTVDSAKRRTEPGSGPPDKFRPAQRSQKSTSLPEKSFRPQTAGKTGHYEKREPHLYSSSIRRISPFSSKTVSKDLPLRSRISPN